MSGARRTRHESLPLNGVSLPKRDRPSRRSPASGELLRSTASATRAAWSRLQTYEVTRPGNTLTVCPGERPPRVYGSSTTRPPWTARVGMFESAAERWRSTAKSVRMLTASGPPIAGVSRIRDETTLEPFS